MDLRNNDARSRNWARDITASSVNKSFAGNQRPATSRDGRNFGQENSDMAQNVSYFEIDEETTAGFFGFGP